MKYFKLNASGTNWIACEFDENKRQIILYDYNSEGEIVEIGTGLY
jgi:hypothetical protein